MGKENRLWEILHFLLSADLFERQFNKNETVISAGAVESISDDRDY